MLLEELFRLSGILHEPGSPEDLDSAFEDVTSQTIIQLQHMVEELVSTVEEVCMSWSLLIRTVLAHGACYICNCLLLQLKNENMTLKDRLAASERNDTQCKEAGGHTASILHRVSGTLGSFLPWFWPLPSTKWLKWRLTRLVPESEFQLIWGSYYLKLVQVLLTC